MFLFFGLLLVFRPSSTDVDDPEALLDVPSLINFYKYPVEVHDIVTQDGYILQLHRVPRGRDPRPAPFSNGSRPVIFFMHGLTGDSSNFVFNPPASSPGYVFADAGFDVWIGNCRGNSNSRRHMTLNTSHPTFWNFTWYDHAHRDLPDSVDFVLDYTGQKSLYYLGHSQGTMIMFAKLAEDDGTFSKKIRQYYALGPVGGINNIVGILGIAEMQIVYDIFTHLVNPQKPLPLDFGFLQTPLAKLCGTEILGRLICKPVIDNLFGLETNSQFNISRTPLYLRHFPSSTSTLNILHWLQVIQTHSLRKLDLGNEANQQIYGAELSPEFDLSTITTPTFLYFSDDDSLTTTVSTKRFLLDKYGPGLKEHYDLDHFSHLDFVMGLRAMDEVYRPIIRTIYDDLKTRNKQ